MTARVDMPRPGRWRRHVGHLLPARTGGAALWYAALTVALTWPVSAGLARDIPSDLGDPLLNCWIVGWNTTRLERLLAGDLAVLRNWWSGNIFHPEPLSLAYSELLVAQSVQVLPIHALTNNLILCYNLLFLLSFFLSALGVYLLVRDLTGDCRAAFVAGLIYGFAPYRTNQLSHLQVLSSQWMPFALLGLHRFVLRARARALGGAVAALTAQNLSCGYFLVYFSLFVPPFVLFDLWRNGHVGCRRRWGWLAGGALVVALCTIPFMRPYIELRRLTGQQRWIEEVNNYAVDAAGWATADRRLHLWGRVLRVFPRPESDLFPGFAAIGLGAVAVGAGVARAWRHTAQHGPLLPPAARSRTARAKRWTAVAAVVYGSVQLAGIVLALTGFMGSYSVGGLLVRIGSVENMLQRGLAAGLVLLAFSRRARALASAPWRSAVFFFALATGVAWWLSLGPTPTSFGHPLNGPKLYALIYHWIPGADGLRVPGRIAMIVTLFLSVLAGYGTSVVLRRAPRHRAIGAAVLCAMIVAESSAAPLTVNRTDRKAFLAPPSRVLPASAAPPLYRAIASLPPTAVIVEFPFGDPPWELQHVYYSTMHWRRLLNGYSGWFPPGFVGRARLLGDVRRDPEAAWRAVMQAGATHAVVHRDAYADGDAGGVPAWLESHGARPIGRFDMSQLFALPAAPTGWLRDSVHAPRGLAWTGVP